MENQDLQPLINHPDEVTFEQFVYILKELTKGVPGPKATFFLKSMANVKAFEFIAKALNDPDLFVRLLALEAISRLDVSQFIDLLIAALKDMDTFVRTRTICLLGERCAGIERVINPIIETLKDSDSGVRWSAVTALDQLKDLRAFEPLLECLHDEDGYVIREAAEVLAKLGGKRAVEPLLDLLQRRPIFLDLDDGTRCDVSGDIAIALGELKDQRTFAPLAKLLDDENADLRACAATALGAQGDLRAVDILQSILEDQDANVRRTAAEALEKLAKNKID